MLHISLTPDTEAKLRERATKSGEDVSVYAARLLVDAINARSADELLAPLRRQVDASGATDEELDRLGETLRTEVWQERQARKPKTA